MREAKPPGWVYGVGAALLLGWPALAQSFGVDGLESKLELDFSSALGLNAALPPSASWGLGGHLEARLTLEPIRFNLVLDPGLQLGSPVFSDPGLTEAYALFRKNDLDLSAGVERLPLEYARLSLPYSMEPVSPLGKRRGLLGLRLGWNPEATRLRLGLLQNSAGAFGILSLRREFAGFELEAHATAPSGRPTVGLGGSGTLEALVLYGEVWYFWNPSEVRYALGLSANLGDGIWTVEGGYTAASAAGPVRHLLAGQYTLPQGEDKSWNLLAKVFFDPDAVRGQLGLSLATSREDSELSVGAAAQLGPEPLALSLKVGIKLFPPL